MEFGDTRLPARFWTKVAPPNENGCWLWTGARETHGRRPSFGVQSRSVTAYVLACEVDRGPRPDGMTCSHLCHTPLCVNPSHIVYEPLATNKRRSTALITHCPRGHEYTRKNVYEAMIRDRNGKYYPHRSCRVCLAMHRKAHRARRRAAPTDSRPTP